MASGARRTTPLFDLMSDRHAGTRGGVPAKPVVRVELTPQPNPAPAPTAVPREVAIPGSVPPSETLVPVDAPEFAAAPAHPSAAPETHTWVDGPEIRLSRLAIGIAVTVVLLGITLGYAIGYSAGLRKGNEESSRLVRQLAPVEDPLNDENVLQPTPNKSAPGGATPAKPSESGVVGGKTERGSQKTVEDSRSENSSGAMLGDPRESGLNYLVLGVLNRDDAASAVEYLSTNGIQAFAVAVDKGSGRGNNPDPSRQYTLYALPGITSEEYRKSVTKKTNLEAEVTRLGAIWQKKHKGSSNFSKTMWAKFD